ncbi:MAG TPA: hypothetical protein VNN80_25385 [Polyangiaceae bacterium]|nr:hypothetical protein [Polyangiaceae bacterium]
MARSSPPSLSSEREPSPRHGPGSGERPIRLQLVLAVLVAIVLIAVPLYLLRRPTPNESEPSDTPARGFGGVIRTEVDAGAAVVEVTLGPLQRVRCGDSASQAGTEGVLCDAPAPLGGVLSRAILGSLDCAPRLGSEGSINYVLEVDFASRRLNVFAGKSGQWRGARVKKTVACVQRALPELDWAGLQHQHQYYAVAILATYPAPETIREQPTFD